MDKEQIQKILFERRVFREAVSTSSGRQFLAWLLNRCLLVNDAGKVKPDLVALANEILLKLGINQPSNQHELVMHLLAAANDSDLVAEAERETL